MSRLYLSNNGPLTDILDGNPTVSKGYLHYANQNPSQSIQSGSFENENYRLMFNNPYKETTESLAPVTSLMHNCFIGFLDCEEENNIGPFILNVSQDESKNAMQILNLDLDLVTEDQIVNDKSSRAKTTHGIQQRLEHALSNRTKSSVKEPRRTTEQMKEFFSSQSLQLKITPLPFDNLYINPYNKRRVSNVDSGSQTNDNHEKLNKTEEDLINVLKEQIQVLKDQNQLLRQQQDVNQRRSSSRPPREYVIRKQSQSTLKSTRNNSATSTDIIIESGSMQSGKNRVKKKTLTNLTLLTNENSSLQEMLQEYMLENEALRQQNHSLEELRASHHSDMSAVSRKNKELSLRVESLSKKVTEQSLQQRLPDEKNDYSKVYHDDNIDTKSYPIMYEKSVPVNGKTSYLHRFDVLKNKPQNEMTKQVVSNQSNVKITDSNVEKPTERTSKSQPGRNLLNESLLEELNRIDVTIKEHIRKNQFNDTLRTMGKIQSPRKN